MKRLWVQMVVGAALLAPLAAFAFDGQQVAADAPPSAAVPFNPPLTVSSPPDNAAVGQAGQAGGVGLAAAQPSSAMLEVAVRLGDGAAQSAQSALPGSAFVDPTQVMRFGDLQAMVELGVKYAHGEGLPKDQAQANQLFCRAARYGSANGLFNLGWAYANGRGVNIDDAVAAALFRKAAERGHEHATQLLKVVRESNEVALPACALPEPLPVAMPLPARPLPGFDDQSEPRIPMAPKEIIQLVQKLAPQYEIDSNLALAVIYAESAFNPQAISSANAQGLMQLIPETAERFGVKQPFKPDENLKGGLAYLRWLLAYFQGDVSLVLAAYNAGEGAVEKHRGIPPYNETREYVKKITGMYRRLTHPYNASVVRPSPFIEQIKRM